MKIRNFAILAVALSQLASFFTQVTLAHAKGVDPEEKVEYYLSDHLGGVDVVLDEQGNVVERRDYLPFGEERVAEGAGDERHGFTGKELDGETGLYYYGARYYDSAIGRFTSLDPWEGDLKNPQSFNKYSYVLNNPLAHTDPTGMFPKNASPLDKLFSVLTFDASSKGGGWLACGVRDYNSNPTQQSLKEVMSLQTQALDRLIKSPFSFTDETWDVVTNGRIPTLDPRLRIPTTDFINQTENKEGVKLRLTDAYRSFEEQDQLYEQGRNGKLGKIVTYAKGGESYHNYGLAFDAAEMKSGNLTGKIINEGISKIAKNLGFEWGGDWAKPKDNPHFQMTFGQSIQSLQSKVKK